MQFQQHYRQLMGLNQQQNVCQKCANSYAYLVPPPPHLLQPQMLPYQLRLSTPPVYTSLSQFSPPMPINLDLQLNYQVTKTLVTSALN